MDTYHAAFWSDLSYSSSDEEDCYRTTHQKRTKQRGNREQRVLDSWTCEEILDGKGPWAQAGEYFGPGYPAPTLRAVSPGRWEGAVRPMPALRPCRANVGIEPKGEV